MYDHEPVSDLAMFSSHLSADFIIEQANRFPMLIDAMLLAFHSQNEFNISHKDLVVAALVALELDCDIAQAMKILKA